MENFIKKVGLDRIAHFGIGGTLFAAFVGAFALSLPYGNNLELSLKGVLLVPLTGYIVLAFVELVKEVFIDSKGDWYDVLATMLGGVFVHICTIIGYVFHLGNGKDLITTTWGWIVFGGVFAILAGLWLWWVVRFNKRGDKG